MSSDTLRTPTTAERLLHLATGGYIIANAIFAAARLDLADAMREGPATSREIAERLQLNADAVHRLLRALASAGVFTQLPDGRFALTELSTLLLGDVAGSMRTLLRGGSARWHHDLWGDLVDAVRTGAPSAQKVLGQPLYEYLQSNPAAGDDFNRAKIGFSHRITEAVLAAYDLTDARVLVDVGGGLGHFLGAALPRYPDLRGVLFDLAAVTGQARDYLKTLALSERVEIVDGDFFSGVPAGGDVYVLMNVLHNWGDRESIEILTRCRKAMGPSARVLAVEMVLPEVASPHFGLLLDLEMMVLFHEGRERTEAQFRALYEAAGLRVSRVIPTAASSWIVEGEPARGAL